MSKHALALPALLLALVLPCAPATAASDGWFGFSLAVEVGGTVLAPRIESATISKVAPGSPADRQRVTVGDLLSEVEGTPIAGMTPDELKARMKKSVGEALKLTLRRSDGASRTVVLVATARPDGSVQ
jgi:C-terminal processing protease CtpA/Prc